MTVYVIVTTSGNSNSEDAYYLLSGSIRLRSEESIENPGKVIYFSFDSSYKIKGIVTAYSFEDNVAAITTKNNIFIIDLKESLGHHGKTWIDDISKNKINCETMDLTGSVLSLKLYKSKSGASNIHVTLYRALQPALFSFALP